MKIRTDFVTNSSSSSFIFKENETEALHKAFADMRYVEKWLFDWMQGINLSPIHEHTMEEIFEVAEWYMRDILKNILTDYPVEHPNEDWEAFNKREWEYIKEIGNKKISDEALKKIAGIFVLYAIDAYGNNIGERYKIDRLSREVIVDCIIEHMSCCLDIWNRSVDEFTRNVIAYNYEKMITFAQEYADICAGVILEELLGAKYMYYSQLETHYLIADAIKASPHCILGCGHMG
ncbi:MAG: hypothetical protein J6A75_02265 [Lachnospiraceae bacterium]|nr:hypothetical protein [Lachnospiraceae bacterium]